VETGDRGVGVSVRTNRVGREEDRAARVGRRPARVVGACLAVTAAALPATFAVVPQAAGVTLRPHALSTSLVWQTTLPDAGSPIGQSSPSIATLDGRGPSVVVGDRTGTLWAFHLSDGSSPAGWPAHTGGAPIDSTPSVASVDGSGDDTVYVGAGNAAQPRVGGYFAFNHLGQQVWGQNATDLNGNYGVQASMAVGSIGGVTGAVAPSLGQNEYALNATNGGVLPGWPFFTADSGFATPALVDLYGNGQTEIVEGGGSSPGVAYGVTYTAGGHLRVLGGGGNLICNRDTNQSIDSSPAVGPFLGGGATGIAFGTGSYYPGASDSNTLFGSDGHCNIAWQTNLGGNTTSSPAIGDVLGDGSSQVIEGADTGSSGLVWVLNGANGAPLPGWPQATSGRIIGGVTTADLTGGGYNDVLVPTTNGLVIFDGRSAQIVATIGAGTIGLQNSPAVTIDPNGSIGITIAGYNAGNAGLIQHYEVGGTTGFSLGKRAWPMFHQNSQLTGWMSAPAPGHLNQPIVGMAATGDGRGYWNVASDGGLFAFGDAGFYGSMGGQPLNKPIVGMASTRDGKGYWLVASDGGLFAFGDAQFFGSTGNLTLNKPVVGMSATPDGGGYWLVASDGGLFAYGDAPFYGSTGNLTLNKPVVGMSSTPNGGGYWLVASDGGLFAYGDALFYGSMGGQPLNRPIVGMAANGGMGYWLVASDGGIFAFGSAPFYGSTGNLALVLPVVDMAVTPKGSGYWMAAADGGLFAYGDAGFYGSIPALFAAANVGVD
jgi:hypothetical protein